jgi:ATP-dependent protease ClpP protease subunit
MKKRKSWYQIRGKASLNSREVQIDLLSDIGGFGISAQSFRDDLQRVGANESIHLTISSDGGDVLEGISIFNQLLAHQGNVRVTINGLAASIASYIAMAGDQIEIMDNAFFMLHNVWSLVGGDSDELRKVAGTMDKLQASIVKAYADQTGMSNAEIESLMDAESWLSATEALRLGFVDRIVDTSDEAAMAASNFNLKQFRNSADFRKQYGGKQNMKRTGQVIVDVVDDDDPVKAERNRISEINSIVALVKKRDSRDFSNDARKAIAEGVSADEFSRALVTSDRYKAQFIIGSGEEDLPEGGDANSLGAMVVRDESYKRMVSQGGLQQGQSLILNFPLLNYGKYRKRFARPQGSTPLTGLPGTGIQILPGVEGSLNIQPARVAPLLGNFSTNGSSVRYISETSFTNAADTVTEGTVKPEQLWNLTEVDSPVRKVAVYSKFSDEILSDHERLQPFVNGRLMAGVELKLDTQLVTGNGTPPNLTGILNFSGIQTQAKAADTVPDAILKAITKARLTGFFEPDAIVVHPTDWQNLRLIKDSAGQYLGGGPFLGTYGNGPYVADVPLWGKPVIITTAITVGTALVGMFRMGGEVFYRTGLMLSFTNSDQDDFIKNLITVRCEIRAALAVVHPLAFCSVTGL